MVISAPWPLFVSCLIALAVGYLFGSIPFGLILTRLAGTADIRTLGSGNIGATNVLRTGRRGLAAATLVGDVLKGTAAALVMTATCGNGCAIAAGLGAFVGHLFPVWTRFRGGKGVATYLGVLIGLAPWPGAVAFAVSWLGIAALTRYSSLAALIAAIATPAVLWAAGQSRLVVLFCVLTIMIFIMHRENIARLIAGTEGKIGTKTPAQPRA